jgi:hypothetical protein
MKGTPMKRLLPIACVVLAGVACRAAAADVPTTRRVLKRRPTTRPTSRPAKIKLFDGKPKILVVNGGSTSLAWPRVLQRKLDRYFDRRRVITVRSAARAATPIARWIDVATGRPRQPWAVVRQAMERPNLSTRLVVLAQQSLQWVYPASRNAGIQSADDEKNITIGADALEKYVRLLKADGADLVFLTTQIYQKPMEPAAGNERFALDALLDRDLFFVARGPDLWTATRKLHPKGYARDGVRPDAVCAEVMAHHWFATLLQYGGKKVPQWSEAEMQSAIEKGPASLLPKRRRKAPAPQPNE